MDVCVCVKCGHTWVPRVENPLVCPCCKRYNWMCSKGNERRVENVEDKVK